MQELTTACPSNTPFLQLQSRSHLSVRANLTSTSQLCFHQPKPSNIPPDSIVPDGPNSKRKHYIPRNSAPRPCLNNSIIGWKLFVEVLSEEGTNNSGDSQLDPYGFYDWAVSKGFSNPNAVMTALPKESLSSWKDF